MISRRWLIWTILGLLSIGCSSLDVQTDFTESFDFSTYRSFSFISDEPLLFSETAPVHPLFEERLVRATRDALELKGYQFVEDREQADFVVSFTIGARDQLQVSSSTTYRGFSPGVGREDRYDEQVEVRNYAEGTLAIDLFDVAQRNAVWHGWVTRTISLQDRRNSASLIGETVAAILADFPPL